MLNSKEHKCFESVIISMYVCLHLIYIAEENLKSRSTWYLSCNFSKLRDAFNL